VRVPLGGVQDQFVCFQTIRSFIALRTASMRVRPSNRLDANLPLVMGYLCDLLSRALANYSTTHLTDAPRLTLAAKIATAAEPFGCGTPFLDLLRHNQHEALISTQDNDAVMAALFSLLSRERVWTGTYKNCFRPSPPTPTTSALLSPQDADLRLNAHLVPIRASCISRPAMWVISSTPN
jgi:hypothetical protein